MRGLAAIAMIAACTPTTPKGSPTASASASAPVIASDASVPDASVEVVEEAPSFGEIVRVLFAGGATPAACPESMASEARTRCLFDERYRGDPKAAGIAYGMLVKWNIVAGVHPKDAFDGGFRGHIELVPTAPTGADRKHLEWVQDAFIDFDKFFVELEAYGKAHDLAIEPSKRYRFRKLHLEFMRSVGGNRPSAMAIDWTISYNVLGSLNTSDEAVRETFFHEIFHLNDAVHPGPHDRWSLGALKGVFDPIAKKCGTNDACLEPFSPNATKVRGGTYYSFQPNNGVPGVEYAAELATRYYREQRIALRNLPKVKPFKCGPTENAKAWELMKNEFFAGIDATPACP